MAGQCALAISADGKTLLSGSFDGSAIRWSLSSDTAQQVLQEGTPRMRCNIELHTAQRNRKVSSTRAR